MEYVSIAIAIIALLISWYSVYENRRNNRIGQTPALMGHEIESPTEYSYVIQNKGTGPAYFEKVEYFLNLQPLDDKPLREAVREVLAKKRIRFHQSTITQLAQKAVMVAGEEILLGRILFLREDGEKFQGIDDLATAIQKCGPVMTGYKTHNGRIKNARKNRGVGPLGALFSGAGRKEVLNQLRRACLISFGGKPQTLQ